MYGAGAAWSRLFLPGAGAGVGSGTWVIRSRSRPKKWRLRNTAIRNINTAVNLTYPSPGLLLLLQLPDVVLHDVGPEVSLKVGQLRRRLDVVLQRLKEGQDFKVFGY